MGGNFEFQVQDSFLEYFFWRFGDMKNTSHFLKKATFNNTELLSENHVRWKLRYWGTPYHKGIPYITFDYPAY